jgi:hypothetical protein
MSSDSGNSRVVYHKRLWKCDIGLPGKNNLMDTAPYYAGGNTVNDNRAAPAKNSSVAIHALDMPLRISI